MPIDRELWDLFVNFEKNKGLVDKKAQEICHQFLGVSWKNNDFKIEKLSGGMTNLVFKCSVLGEKVLLRIQCDKDIMQLQTELVIFMKLAENNLGPKLLGVFPGGRIEEFIESRTLTYDEVRSPGYSQQIARTLAKIHQIEVPLPKPSQMITIMRQWLVRIEKNGDKEFKVWSKNAGIPEDRFPKRINLDELSRQIDGIEEYLKKCHSPCRLTHNDLYATNILLRDGFLIDEQGNVTYSGEETTSLPDPLVIIDFEFGMYNFRGFDIGNHMNELGLTYFEEMPTYSFDLKKLQDRSLHRNFCSAYLQETYARLIKNCTPYSVDQLTGDLETDLADLEKEAISFQAIANFFWACWNIICDQEKIIGMDFHNAWRDRLSLYYYMKNF